MNMNRQIFVSFFRKNTQFQQNGQKPRIFQLNLQDSPDGTQRPSYTLQDRTHTEFAA